MRQTNSTEAENLLILLTNFAETHGCEINPDKKRVNTVIKALIARQNRFGQLYCPCRVLQMDPTIDNDIVCPCVFRESDIELRGQCYCRLFVEKRKGDVIDQMVDPEDERNFEVEND